MDTHETREKEMRASFVCVIQLFLSPMFFVRETIKIYLCSLICDEFTRLCGVTRFVFELYRGVLLSLLRRSSRLVRERGSNPVVCAGVSSRIGTRGSNGGNDQGC